MKLSIIIPFHNKIEMTVRCIESIYEFVGIESYEILLVNNRSDMQAIEELMKSLKPNTRIIDYNFQFNYQKINNFAVENSNGDFLLFLNNDTEFSKESTKLVSGMITKAGQKDIGAVGCLLLYEDRDTIQHAGVYLVSGGYADHLHMNEKYSSSLNEHAKNELDYLKDKEVIAVTAAALLVEKKKFEETGGFNEKFVVCGGDVDLCLRLGEKGYKSFYIGSKGFIIHKESQSRQGNEIPYIDFIESFKSYRKYFDKKNND